MLPSTSSTVRASAMICQGGWQRRLAGAVHGESFQRQGLSVTTWHGWLKSVSPLITGTCSVYVGIEAVALKGVDSPSLGATQSSLSSS